MAGAVGRRDVTTPWAVAVDGLSGVGKSTVARAVAGECGWAYLDTGASYRAVTWAALDQHRVVAGVDAVPATEVPALLRLVERALADLQLSLDPGRPGVRLAGHDRSADIRSESVTATVSAVSAVPAVRTLLAGWQRATVLAGAGTVAEGRDLGTVVLPDAPLKVWLSADAADRAARRAGDRHATGGSEAEVRRSVDRRDALDTSRATAPARPAADAVVVDTSGQDAAAVTATVLALMAERGLCSGRAR